MKNYFAFIIYLAFRNILIYENKRSLTIEQLHNYRLRLCKKHVEYHNQFSEYDDEGFEQNLRFFHSSNIDMTLEDEGQNFHDFINDNSDYFFYKDGVIYLRNEINYKELEKASFELDCYVDRDDRIICGELLTFDDCIECLNILGAKKIKDYVSEIIDAEKKVEKAYQTNKVNQNLEKLLTHINFKLGLIGKLNDNKLTCFHRMIHALSKYDIDAERKDILLLSDYLMENDKFYKLNSQGINYIASNGFQRAIFDKGTLAYDKLDNIMNAIWTYREPNVQLELELADPEAFASLMDEWMQQIDSFDDEFEEIEEQDYDEYEEEDDMDQVDIYLYRKKINMSFYLNYIDHIDKFFKLFGSDVSLENSKSRLLYLLDSYGDNLYEEKNFNNALKNVSMDEIDYKDDFDDFYTLSRLFLVDILEGWICDEMSLRKILFVSTYYDLTKDRRIERIINKYKKTEVGGKISKIVLKNDYSELISAVSKSGKQLIKKKKNKNKEK